MAKLNTWTTTQHYSIGCDVLILTFDFMSVISHYLTLPHVHT